MTAASLLCSSPIFVATAEEPQASWSVCFTPGDNCTDVIVREIAAAKRTVRVQAYSFTSAPIAKAIVDAYKRGVDVRVILDKSQRTERYSSADYLTNAGVPTWIDTCCAIAHNKVMILDGETVITGSFNFTKAAQDRNAENLLVLRSRELAQRYAENWEEHLQTSQRYQSRASTQ